MSRKKLTRRGFLRATGDGAKAAVGVAVAGKAFWPRAAHAGAGAQIYSAFHENMVNGSTPTDVQEAWVRAGVDACARAMSGATTLDQAWRAIFPGITTAKKIAIKVNCLNTSVYPQLATMRALVESICSLFGGTFPPGNISLFDNNLWTSGKVDACYGSSTLDALGIVHGEDTYASGQTVSVGGTTMYVSKYWADADYGISLAKMAPHQYYAGGLSGVIKNMMGALSENNNASYSAKRSNGGFHDDAPYTAFRDLWTGYASSHLHLHVVDMLFACLHENESGWSRVVKRITMGADPCAVDAYNVDKINELGMSVAQPVTKAVPEALAAAGVGSTSYVLVEPEVSLGPPAPGRDDLDQALRERRGGLVSDAEVRQLIKGYREQS